MAQDWNNGPLQGISLRPAVEMPGDNTGGHGGVGRPAPSAEPSSGTRGLTPADSPAPGGLPEQLPAPAEAGASARTYAAPSWLPRYDLAMQIDVEQHMVTVREKVTWTNPANQPTDRLVFNNHSRYTIPDKDIGLLAKSLELLRLAPSEAFDFNGPPCNVQKAELVNPVGPERQQLHFDYLPENNTALEIKLPFKVDPGAAVTVELAFTLRLPQRQGRWGQWCGVTFLAQWLPVAAFYDEHGWHPTPFIPWHQPFLNEAGIYRAQITVPFDQRLGCTGSIQGVTDLGNGWKRIDIGEVCARDFAVFCSKNFREVVGQSGPVRVRCLHLPGHEFYAKEMVRIACEALPVYCQWFGPYPYPEFLIVESYFGWNGNECGGLVMIDERVFDMPHLAVHYVDSLLTHEICHQWFYNVVGTDGYAETWMDEGLATYFCHRVMDRKLGKNNALLQYPQALNWLPNIHRDDFRNYGMYGVIARGESTATVQEMPGFQHLVTLMGMTYDRGSRIVGMIQDMVDNQMGPDAFFDFMRQIYAKYYFRIIRVKDFQRELEAYSGRPWDEFFQNWLYGAGMCDWCVDRVEIEPLDGRQHRRGWLANSWLADKTRSLFCVFDKKADRSEPQHVVVYVRQKAEYTEPTVLGFALQDQEHYDIRVPIIPGAALLEMEDLAAKMETVDKDLVRVEIVLPCRPVQITVDPDQVLLDRNPANNYWKPCMRARLTLLYTQLDETDITTAYDRWNVMVGPWAYFATYNNPWYSLSPLVGVRAGVYRTQEFSGGAYLAYRTNDRNIVAGADGLLDHVPWPETQIGFNVERSLSNVDDSYNQGSRAVLFGRYVLLHSSSLYLPPFEYVEAYSAVQNQFLPDARSPPLGAERVDNQTSLGIHYHKFYLTPYWNPEGGLALDATIQEGLPVFGSKSSQEAWGQVSFVKYTPDPFGILKETPWLHWLADSRWAFRLYGAAAQPEQDEFFALGGGEMFRGYDVRQRQGSMVWLASVEWRVPLVKGLEWDCVDHIAGLRGIYGAVFYDVGNAYVNGQQTGPIAHAVGVGLRLDVTWIGLIERTMLRFDVARTVNDNTPWQFWFGIMYPF
jgi:hypothetical protein